MGRAWATQWVCRTDTAFLSDVPRKDRVDRTRHNNTRAVGKLKTAEMEPVSLRGQAVSKST